MADIGVPDNEVKHVEMLVSAEGGAAFSDRLRGGLPAESITIITTISQRALTTLGHRHHNLDTATNFITY